MTDRVLKNVTNAGQTSKRRHHKLSQLRIKHLPQRRRPSGFHLLTSQQQMKKSKPSAISAPQAKRV